MPETAAQKQARLRKAQVAASVAANKARIRANRSGSRNKAPRTFTTVKPKAPTAGAPVKGGFTFDIGGPGPGDPFDSIRGVGETLKKSR